MSARWSELASTPERLSRLWPRAAVVVAEAEGRRRGDERHHRRHLRQLVG